MTTKTTSTKATSSVIPDQVEPDVDLNHPAVDYDPRANTTPDQNRIDFNDPRLSGSEAVEQNLAAQKAE